MVRPLRLGRHPELVAAVEAMQLHEAKVHRLSVECRTCPGRARSSADPRMLRRVRGLYPADPYVEHARFTTERSDGDPVCGEVWRLWQMQRHGQHHVASGAGSRSPSERQRRGSKRCDSAARRLLGANLSRCREDGCGAAAVPDRRSAKWGVHQPDAPQSFQRKSICPAGRPEVGSQRLVLHQGARHNCHKEKRCHRQAFQQRGKTRFTGRSKESSKEDSPPLEKEESGWKRCWRRSRSKVHRSSIPAFRHWKTAGLCATDYDGGQPKSNLRK